MDSRQRQPVRPTQRSQAALRGAHRGGMKSPGAEPHPPEAERRRRTLLVAAAVGLFAILLLATPRMMAWQRGRFVQRLGRQAEAASGEAARLTVRRLAQQGDHALGTLVLLAGSSNHDAALEACRAVGAQYAAWDFDARATGDRRLLADRLERLAAAIAAHAASFPPPARQWADGVALDMVAQCDALPAERALAVLGLCDRALGAPRVVGLAAGGGEGERGVRVLAAAKPRAAEVAGVGGPAPWSVLPRPLATAGIETRPSAPAPESVAEERPADSVRPGQGAELRLVEPPVTAMPTTPTPTDELLAPPGTEAAPRVADLAEQATPLPAPEADAQLVEVPTPQQARLLRRRLRQMNEQELAAELGGASPYVAAAIADVLRERQLTARSNRNSRLRAPLTVAPSGPPRPESESSAVAAIGALPPAEARAALRRLARDETATADDRLQALTMLATSNDPALMAIAQERAAAEADPRVAELATRILKDAIAK